MTPQTEPTPTVVYRGRDEGFVREAAAESTVVADPDRVLSVTPAVGDSASIEAAEPRAVVCDVNAGDADALAELRELFPEVPSLALVAEDDAVADALAAGATDVFVRRDGIDGTALLARRLDAVATTPVAPSPTVESAEPSLGADPAERLLDAIDDSFYALDADGSLERWNDRFREVTGYDDAELADMHALDFFAGTDRDRVADAVDAVFDRGNATVEAELVTKDGETVPIEYTGALVTDAEGAPQGVVGVGRDVTQRREREHRLVRLRQAVETIVDGAPLTLFEVAPDATVTTVRGDTLSRRLPRGLEPGDAVADAFADHPEVRRGIEAALGGESSRGLVEAGDATLETLLQPTVDETGTVSRVICLAIDVTAREDRAAMLDQIQANAGEVIWLSTPGKESMDFVTDAYEDVWGRAPETLYRDPMSFVGAIHPDDRQRVETALADQRENPDAYEETYRVVRPDGEVRWVHDQSAGVYEDDELTRIVGIATDVTVRKRRERELRLTNRAVETAPVGIAIHETGDGSITQVNERFEATTGRDRDAVTGEGLSVLGGDDTDGERLRALEAAVETGDRASGTLVLHRADGSPFWGRVDVAPVVGPDGETTHAVSFLQDVTESKEHEQEIERHLTEFGEVLAEDLGTPLREADRRLDAAVDDESSSELKRARRAVETAVSLVDDLATVHSFSVEPRRLSESMRGSAPAPTEGDE